MIDYVVGCPVWDRAWCLDAWFDCVEANVPADRTGLVFVVPPSDQGSRDVISRRGEAFAAVEVLRDQLPNLGRGERVREDHKTLATARNRILRSAVGMDPKWFISWDSDFFVPKGAVEHITKTWPRFPVQGVWAWLNRQPPQEIVHKGVPCLWQPPMASTVMEWNRDWAMAARHLDAADWEIYNKKVFPADLVLAFQVMTPQAFRIASYAPHQDDEHVPFFWKLCQRNIQPMCHGNIHGVHLYNRQADEPQEWPVLMKLAEQRPLAAERRESERTQEQKALGLFPTEVAV